MSIFVLKAIAYISMFIDHAYKLFPEISNYLLIFLGRLAFPIFCFGIVEGYLHTKDIKQYIKRLLILGLVSQIPYSLYLYVGNFSKIDIIVVPFTLLLGLFAIMTYDRQKNWKTKIIKIITIVAIAFLLKVDYSYYGIILILILYIFRDKKFLRNCLSILLVLFKYLLVWNNYLDHQMHGCMLLIGEISGVLLLNLYNGKKGGSPKYSKIFYFLYPIQLIVLVLIKLLIK